MVNYLCAWIGVCLLAARGCSAFSPLLTPCRICQAPLTSYGCRSEGSSFISIRTQQGRLRLRGVSVLSAKKRKDKGTSIESKAVVKREKTGVTGALDRTKEVAGVAWKGTLLVATVASVILAIDSLLKLRTQSITVENLIPTLTNLLPLAGFGVFGVLRIVAVATRILRVILTIPIILGGAYLAAPSIPDFFKHSPDLATGGFFALLATPEVIEAIALLAILAGATIWIVKQFIGLGAMIVPKNGTEEEDDGDLD